MENNIFSFLIDNLNKLFYPEEWILLDMTFTKSEIFTMLVVDRHGEIIMSQVAGYINVPMSTATGIVDRLVKNGYLKRERSEQDRRIVVICLSDKGKEVIDKLKESVMKYIGMINDSLTDEERQLLYNIFIKFINILNRDNSDKNVDLDKKGIIKKIDIE